MDLGVDGVEQVASTGSLPTWDRVEDLVTEAFERNRAVDAGVVASYIPVLAKADPELFGISVVEVDGGVHGAGDAEHTWSSAELPATRDTRSCRRDEPARIAGLTA